MTPHRPILRWHGGKWRLAPFIVSHFPAHRVYVEPYGGAASVLLRKERAYAEVYNDLDCDVVNLFRVLQDEQQAERLADLISLTPFAENEFKLAYEAAGDPVERARRLVIRSFMGRGADGALNRTGFRSDTSRNGSIPAHDWAAYPQALRAIVERLAGVVIENRDALIVSERHDGSGTLHYVDPPYPRETRQDGHLYSHEMTTADHERMAAALHDLAGMVVLSGYPCDLYDKELFAGWHRVDRDALADGARKRTEVLWLNEAAASALSLHRAGGPLFERANP